MACTCSQTAEGGKCKECRYLEKEEHGWCHGNLSQDVLNSLHFFRLETSQLSAVIVIWTPLTAADRCCLQSQWHILRCLWVHIYVVLRKSDYESMMKHSQFHTNIQLTSGIHTVQDCVPFIEIPFIPKTLATLMSNIFIFTCDVFSWLVLRKVCCISATGWH